MKQAHCFILLQGLVRPKIKITQWFTHPQAILGEYDFIFQLNTIGDILRNAL